MVKVYFDLETYRPKKEDAFKNEKIIAVGFLIDFTEDGSINYDIKEYKYGESLPETGVWKYIETDEKINEKELVSRFFNILNNLKKKDNVIIIGYNILRFDIPLISQRSKTLGIRELEDTNSFIFNTFTIDYFQLCLKLNNMLFNGNRLEGCVEKVSKMTNQKPPIQRVGKGSDIASLYESKKYDEIVNHLESDIILVRYLDITFKKLKIHVRVSGM